MPDGTFDPEQFATEFKELGETITVLRDKVDSLEGASATSETVIKLEEHVTNLGKSLSDADTARKAAEKEHEATLNRLETIEKELSSGILATKSGDDDGFIRTKFDDLQSMYLRQDTKGLDIDDWQQGVASSIAQQELAIKSGGDVDFVVKSLVAGSNPNAGWLVTPDMRGRIDGRIFRTSPIRSLATVISTTSDMVEFILDDDEADAGWVGEVDGRPNTANPDVGRIKIPIHELYANPKISQKMLDDAAFDVEGWLTTKVSDKFGRVENSAFVNGDGNGKPKGFLQYESAGAGFTYDDANAYERGKLGTYDVNLKTGGSTTADGLKIFQSILKPEYAGNATWLMKHTTFGNYIVTLKDANGQYLLRFGDSLREGDALRLLGRPVVLANDMPDAETLGNLPIGYGDWSECYTVVDRIGIRLLRDPYTQKPFVQFYMTKRTGGGLTNFDALKLIRQPA